MNILLRGLLLLLSFGIAGPAGAAPVCGQADLSKLAALVYVTPDGADGPACGSASAPCASLQQGLQNCAPSGCGVLLRWGLYPVAATVSLRNGVNVYGGCSFDGSGPTSYRTVLQGSQAPGTPVLSAAGITAPTLIYGLVVVGRDENGVGAAVAGIPSIAMAVSDSNQLTLSYLTLSAGHGGNGGIPADAPPGQAGGQGGASYCDSCRGAPGPACPSAPPPPGVGNGGTGAGRSNISSSGCFLDCKCSLNGSAIPNGDNGQGSGSAAGGGGAGRGSSGCNCDDRPNTFGTIDPGTGGTGGGGGTGDCSTVGGSPGPGLFGQPGGGATWTAGAGGTGPVGGAGAGGGGGGAGGYATDYGNPDVPGYAAGGGGGGGCGGTGGQGGQQGGASIALLIANSAVAGLADANSFVAGPGGTGSTGGRGGVGGPGGGGGPGYHGPQSGYKVLGRCYTDNAPGWGGDGGPGGQGGASSGGSGGNGGPSVAIGYRGSPPALGSALDARPGPPGGGGGGGAGGVNPNCTAATGASGVSGGAAAAVNLDQPPTSILAPGQSLTEGQFLLSPSGATQLILQTDTNFCMYQNQQYRWCSLQWLNATGQQVIMQTDGNLCILNNGQPAFCSGTYGHPGAYLMVEDDAHAAVYQGSVRLWGIPQ
jgi:hypothetical protein